MAQIEGEGEKELWAQGLTHKIIASVQRCPDCPGGEGCLIDSYKKRLIEEAERGTFYVRNTAEKIGLEYKNFGLNIHKKTWHFECVGQEGEKGKLSVSVEEV